MQYSESEIRSALVATGGDRVAAAKMLREHAEAMAAAGNKRTSSERDESGDESDDSDDASMVDVQQQQGEKRGRRNVEGDAAAVQSITDLMQQRMAESAVASRIVADLDVIYPHITERMLMELPPKQFRQLIGPHGQPALRAITQSPSFQAAYKAEWYVDVDMTKNGTTTRINVGKDSTFEDALKVFIKREWIAQGFSNPTADDINFTWQQRNEGAQGTMEQWWNAAIRDARAGNQTRRIFYAWTSSPAMPITLDSTMGSMPTTQGVVQIQYRQWSVLRVHMRGSEHVEAETTVVTFRDGRAHARTLRETRKIADQPPNFLWTVGIGARRTPDFSDDESDEDFDDGMRYH